MHYRNNNYMNLHAWLKDSAVLLACLLKLADPGGVKNFTVDILFHSLLYKRICATVISSRTQKI